MHGAEGPETAPEVAEFIAARRWKVGEAAVRDLNAASQDELPATLHRLAGKLGTFGFAPAGDAARRLLEDLRDGDVVDTAARVADIVALIESAREV